MQIEALFSLFLPLLVAAGSAFLCIHFMQARMEVALAKERESLAEARATINAQKITLEERVKATEESTKRLAMDEFMRDFRVEERSYGRESKTASSSKKSMIMQERLYFRNIPLSNWIEREMVVEEGVDLDQLPRQSVFTPSIVAPLPNVPMPGPAGLSLVKSDLRRAHARGGEVVVAIPAGDNEPRNLVSVYLAAFGAK